MISILFLSGFIKCIKSDHQIKLFITKGKILFQNTQIELEFDNKMYCKVFYRSGKKRLSINNSDQGGELSVPSHYIRVNGQDVKDFNVDYNDLGFSDIKEKFGTGKQIVIKGTAGGPEGIKIKKILTVKLSNDYPNAAVTSVVYKNLDSSRELKIDKVYSESYRLNSNLAGNTLSSYDFYLLRSGLLRSGLLRSGLLRSSLLRGEGYLSGNNKIVKLDEYYSQENFQERNSADFDTGMPVLDLWNKTMGMVIGHIESIFKSVSLPITVQSDKNVMIGVVLKPENDIIPPGGVSQTIKTMVSVHGGDSYDDLKFYYTLMRKSNDF